MEIITSGGDCGGLNTLSRALLEAYAHGGGNRNSNPRNSYAGLYNLVDLENVVVLNAEKAKYIEASLAGSEAGHSRVKDREDEELILYDRIKAGLKKFKMNALIIN